MNQLTAFIAASKAHGASDDFLAQLLIRRGWPEDAVYSALGDYWASLTGVPVPERKTSAESSREAFLYLVAFSTLCSWSCALGSAMFAFIDHWFPDPASPGSFYQNVRSSVTWQMATLAVAFPIFLLVMRAILKENEANPQQAQSGVRKWLTYIALLLTAGTMITDLIWFLDLLLQGEITVRFVLKSAVVMLIAGPVFLYYLNSLRARTPRWNFAAAVASSVAVLAVFLLGFGIAGTPAQNRLHEADRTRVLSLQRVARAIHYATAMPATLDELVQQNRIGVGQIRDPLTDQPFSYHPTGGNSYQLCATFANPSGPEGPNEVNAEQFWRHSAGLSCYTLDRSTQVP